MYQKMIDRGWRRSGTYCYKPDLQRSCCPQYTIKLDALEFKPSKSQRKLVNRWNRFVVDPQNEDAELLDLKDKDCASRPASKKGKAAPKSPPFSWPHSLHASESETLPEAQCHHRFEVTLEPASYTTEKYALYERYQTGIHHDTGNTPGGFKRFLVDSPLHREPIPYATTTAPGRLPDEYGSYHQMYRLDGDLIAIGVLDILPTCVSSVYFMYDPAWERFSFGKLSALREVALAREIHDAGASEMNALYMGFYIHSCPKMRYKGEYAPSYLADPETYAWYPLATCTPLLETHRYACFAHPEHSLAGPPPSAGTRTKPTPTPFPPEALPNVFAVQDMQADTVSLVPLTNTPQWRRRESRAGILSCLVALGPDIAQEAALFLGTVDEDEDD